MTADYNGDPDALGRALQKAINDWRKKFEGSSAVFSMLNKDWKAVYAKSEEAAKAQLLKDSSDAGELNALREQQAALTRKLEEKQAALDRTLSEFNGIPGKVIELRARLDNIANWRAELDANALKEQYKNSFREWVTSMTPNAATRMQQAIQFRIETDWRLECFLEWEAEARAELDRLTVRNRQLAKQLGQKKHEI